MYIYHVKHMGGIKNEYTKNKKPEQRNPLKRSLIITLLLCLGFCTLASATNKNTPGTFPGYTIPVAILVTIAIMILLVIRFVIKQYFILKNTYRNLEQNMQQGYQQAAQYTEFVEYPYPNIQQQYINPTPTPQNYSHPSQAAQRNRRNYTFSSAFSIFSCMVLLFSSFYFPYKEQKRLDDNYTATAAQVTETEVTTTTSYDDEGEETVNYTYHVTFKYSFDNKEYSGYFSTSRYHYEGEEIQIYVTPDDPNNWEYPDDHTFFLYALRISLSVVILILLLNPSKNLAISISIIAITGMMIAGLIFYVR